MRDAEGRSEEAGRPSHSEARRSVSEPRSQPDPERSEGARPKVIFDSFYGITLISSPTSALKASTSPLPGYPAFAHPLPRPPATPIFRAHLI